MTSPWLSRGSLRKSNARSRLRSPSRQRGKNHTTLGSSAGSKPICLFISSCDETRDKVVRISSEVSFLLHSIAKVSAGLNSLPCGHRRQADTAIMKALCHVKSPVDVVAELQAGEPCCTKQAVFFKQRFDLSSGSRALNQSTLL